MPKPLGLDTRPLSAVEAKKVAWLWWQRIPLGKLTLLCGDPGVGKTWLALDVMARVTTGRGFPDAGADNPFGGEPREVLWVSGEDDDADTIKPRVQTLDGDPHRVHSLVCVVEGGKERTLDLGKHLAALDAWLDAHPLTALVAIDPVTAFLGKVDSHRDADVRALLTPLAKLAARRRVAVLGISHLSKMGKAKALHRAIGSIGFVAAARAAWLVVPDRDDKDRRLFLALKVSNQSVDVGGLAFRVGPNVEGAFAWEDGTVDVNADVALASLEDVRGDKEDMRAVCMRWLLARLYDGERHDSKQIDAEAEALGFARESTLNHARKELGVKCRKLGKRWVMWLPDPDQAEA